MRRSEFARGYVSKHQQWRIKKPARFQAVTRAISASDLKHQEPLSSLRCLLVVEGLVDIVGCENIGSVVSGGQAAYFQLLESIEVSQQVHICVSSQLKSRFFLPLRSVMHNYVLDLIVERMVVSASEAR